MSVKQMSEGGKVRALPAPDKQPPRREPPTRERVLFLRAEAARGRGRGLRLVKGGDES